MRRTAGERAIHRRTHRTSTAYANEFGAARMTLTVSGHARKKIAGDIAASNSIVLRKGVRQILRGVACLSRHRDGGDCDSG